MSNSPPPAPPPPSGAPDSAPSLEPDGPAESSIMLVFIAMAVFTMVVSVIILALVAGDTHPAENHANITPGSGPWHMQQQPRTTPDQP